MTSQSDIDEFLARRRFAFVGLSREPKHFCRALFQEFRKQGYDPVPVHPEAAEIEGRRCFTRVQEIDPPVDAALLMTPAPAPPAAAADCVAAGVQHVWFYRGAGTGSVSAAAVEHCRANGLSVIPGECPFMFLPGATLVHRFHGWVKKIRGT